MPTPLNIALADDEVEIRDYFASALTRMGHRIVVSASDGRSLIDGCRQHDFDLVITDIRMGEPDGIEAIRQLSAEKDFGVILISAHYRWDEIDCSIKNSVLSFLSKPVKIADLQAAVDAAAEQLQR